MRKRTILQIIFVSILSLTLAPSPASDNGAASEHDPIFAPEAAIRPLEVRTRRLHMVRPDLMHYPLQYDTYC